MSSSDSDDGFYSNVNVVKNIRIAREQCRKNLECQEQDDSTKNTGKSHEGSSTVENDVDVVKIKLPENLPNNTTNDSFIDSVEDDMILDEIIAKNSKPVRGRGRGRKKKETTVEPPKPPEAINSCGSGRSRGRSGKRGRTSKNNVTDTELSNALDTFELLNGTSNRRRRNGNSSTSEVDNSIIADILNTLTGRGRGRGRKRRATYSPNSSVEEVLENLLTGNVTRRGRGSRRSRGWGSQRGRGNAYMRQPITDIPLVLPSVIPLSYPIYSVGNTDEYYDKSDDIPLFSKPTNTTTNVTDDVVVLDNEEIDNADDNEPLSVKVIWKSLDISKFTIRKYQKLMQIFDYFAQKENVGKDKLLFTYNNKILTCDDTPASIDYNIAKFIDGGIVSQSIKNIVHEKTKVNGVQIKFQCQNIKKPIEITIGKDDKVLLAMTQCAERLELPLNKLKFEFDGDIVVGTSTPLQMGLENGDCIDVIILS